MKTRLLIVLLAAGLLLAAMFTAFTIPVVAQQEVVWVQLPTGEIVPVEVPPGTDPASMELPGPIVPPPTTTEPPAPPKTPTTPAPELPPPTETTPAPGPAPATPQPAPQEPDTGPGTGGGSPRERTRPGGLIERVGPDKRGTLTGEVESRPKDEPSKDRSGGGRRRQPRRASQPRRHTDARQSRLRRCAPRSRPRRRVCPTSSSASSGCRRSCCRSTRRRESSTASVGRSLPRSTRSRPTTDATSTSRARGRWDGCSSCPRHGRPTGPTPTRTAERTPTTPSMQSSPRLATSRRPTTRTMCARQSGPTTTPTGTSTRCCSARG